MAASTHVDWNSEKQNNCPSEEPGVWWSRLPKSCPSVFVCDRFVVIANFLEAFTPEIRSTRHLSLWFRVCLTSLFAIPLVCKLQEWCPSVTILRCILSWRLIVSPVTWAKCHTPGRDVWSPWWSSSTTFGLEFGQEIDESPKRSFAKSWLASF